MQFMPKIKIKRGSKCAPSAISLFGGNATFNFMAYQQRPKLAHNAFLLRLEIENKPTERRGERELLWKWGWPHFMSRPFSTLPNRPASNI